MKPALLVRLRGEEKWRLPPVTQYEDEAALQLILRRSPELVPGSEERRPTVVVDEFPVSFGWADLVGVSATGWITVVECKLRANPDIRRTIVGQVLAYGAAMWQLTYSEFDRGWQTRAGLPLADHVARELADVDPGWDAAAFAEAVAANLEAGRFTLVVAVDDITPELQRIIEYLSRHTDSELAVVALELGYVADGEHEILVPQAYGVEIAERKSEGRGPRRQWNEQSFFADLQARRPPEEVAVARALLEWGQQRMTRIAWGTGAQTGSFYPMLDQDTIAHSVLIVNSSGRVQVPFGYMASRPPFTDDRLGNEFAAKLTAAGFNVGPWGNRWPSIALSRLVDEGALSRFLVILDWAADLIDNQSPPHSAEGPDQPRESTEGLEPSTS